MVLKVQMDRQHSSIPNPTKVDASGAFLLDGSTAVYEEYPFTSMSEQQQHGHLLVSQRKHTDSDNDSGTEEIEQQLEQMALVNSNDHEEQESVKSYGANDDEGFSEHKKDDDPNVLHIKQDLMLAKSILDVTKKDFCADTRVAFHGEFARLISLPVWLHCGYSWYLFCTDDLVGGPYQDLIYSCTKLDNAKAQFQCPNPTCQHAWTSMRARISFSIAPQLGFLALKIFGQNCQRCYTYTNALWYIDEVCRVMRNTAHCLFSMYYPDMVHTIETENQIPAQNDTVKYSRSARHDPSQRKGKMMSNHAKEHCEACQYGLCFM